MIPLFTLPTAFESFVNSEECKTNYWGIKLEKVFESFVNSEECKTIYHEHELLNRLRALLIQKSVKQVHQLRHTLYV